MTIRFLNIAGINGANAIDEIVKKNHQAGLWFLRNKKSPACGIYTPTQGFFLSINPPSATSTTEYVPLLIENFTDDSYFEIYFKTIPTMVSWQLTTYSNANELLNIKLLSDVMNNVNGKKIQFAYSYIGSPAYYRDTFANRTDQPSIKNSSKITPLHFKLKVSGGSLFYKFWSDTGTEPSYLGGYAMSVDMKGKDLLFQHLSDSNDAWPARYEFIGISDNKNDVWDISAANRKSIVSGIVMNKDLSSANGVPVSIIDPVTGGLLGSAITSDKGEFSTTLEGTPPDTEVIVIATDSNNNTKQQPAAVGYVKTAKLSVVTQQSYYQPIK